jgi:predicted Zn-dependent protease
MRVVRTMADRRHEIVLARARQSDRQPDALELLNLAWNDYWLADTEADLARADARFAAVLQMDPSSVAARFGRAMSCHRTFANLFSATPRATLSECERQVRELYSRAPEHILSMQAMASVLDTQGKPEEALWLIRKALDLWPADRTLNQYMAQLLVKEGRFDEAEPYLEFTRSMAERRREHGPSDRRRQTVFYHLFATRAALQGRDDESREWLLRWTAEFPDDGRPYLLLAAIDALHGRDEQARSSMARHRQLLPRSNLQYVAMVFRTSNPAVMAVRARLVEGMRRAGLPEGG